MGGAQPLAATMNGGVFLGVEVDPHRARSGASRRATSTSSRKDLDEALALVDATRRPEAGAGPSRVIGNAAEVFPELVPARRQARSRHRPDLRARSAQRLRPRGPVARARRRSCARRDPKELRRRAPAIDGRRTCRRCSTSKARAATSSTTATTSARRRKVAGVRERLRLPRLRARVHPAAVLRGQGPVPLGGALGRSRGHPPHRPRGAGAVPAEEVAAALARAGAASGSRSRACPRASAGWATASATRRAWCSTSWCARAR